MNEIPADAMSAINTFLAEQAAEQAARNSGKENGKKGKPPIPNKLTGMTHSEAVRLAHYLAFETVTQRRSGHDTYILGPNGYKFSLPGDTNDTLSAGVEGRYLKFLRDPENYHPGNRTPNGKPHKDTSQPKEKGKRRGKK